MTACVPRSGGYDPLAPVREAITRYLWLVWLVATLGLIALALALGPKPPRNDDDSDGGR